MCICNTAVFIGEHYTVFRVIMGINTLKKSHFSLFESNSVVRFKNLKFINIFQHIRIGSDLPSCPPMSVFACPYLKGKGDASGWRIRYSNILHHYNTWRKAHLYLLCQKFFL